VQASHLAPHLAGKRVPLTVPATTNRPPIFICAPGAAPPPSSISTAHGRVSSARAISPRILLQGKPAGPLSPDCNRLAVKRAVAIGPWSHRARSQPSVRNRRDDVHAGALHGVGLATLFALMTAPAMPNVKPLSTVFAISVLSAPLTANANAQTIHRDQFITTMEGKALSGTSATGADVTSISCLVAR